MADWTYQPSEGIPELCSKFQAKLFEKLKQRQVAQHATLITRINTLVRHVTKEFVDARDEATFKTNILSCYRLWEPDKFLRPWALWEGQRAPIEAELELQDGAERPGVVPEFYWTHVNDNAYEVAVEVLQWKVCQDGKQCGVWRRLCSLQQDVHSCRASWFRLAKDH